MRFDKSIIISIQLDLVRHYVYMQHTYIHAIKICGFLIRLNGKICVCMYTCIYLL